MNPLPSPQTPTIIRATSSADFLALLPAFIGYAVTNSLLAVLFVGNRTYGSLRFDLPESDAPRDFGSLVAAVEQALRGIPGVDGVAFAVMTDRSSIDCRGVPYRNFARRLEHRAVRSGLVLRDSCCVASDGWCSYLAPEPRGTMRPLSEIEHSMAGLEAAVITDRAVPDLEDIGVLPPVDLDRAAAIRRSIDELSEKPARAARGMQFTGPRLSALVGSAGAGVTELDAARIAVAAGDLAGWLRLVCAAMEATIAGHYPNGALGAPDAGPVSEAKYVADCLDRGGAFDDPAELTRAFGPLEHTLVMYAAIQPDRDACRRAIDLMSEVTAQVPREYQPGLRCLLAWLWWWIGLSSVAAKQVEAALGISPEHRLTTMMGHLVDSGRIPEWALSLPLPETLSA